MGDIPENANDVDVVLPHPDTSCHRCENTRIYLRNMKGRRTYTGAEWHAPAHIQMARDYFAIGNVAEATFAAKGMTSMPKSSFSTNLLLSAC